METRPLGRFIGDYPIERLLVDSIRSRLTVEENLARDFIMEFIINFQQPCPLPLAVSQLRLQKPELEWDKIITSLLDKRMVVCSEDLLAEFVYPVSAEPTSHEVTLKDGRHFYAMCAVDALGSAFTFHQDTQIRSVCAECGQPISIVINNGLLTSMAPTDPYVLYTDHGSAENWTGST